MVLDDGRVTGIIDWQYAGWYPESGEYGTFQRGLANKLDTLGEQVFPLLSLQVFCVQNSVQGSYVGNIPFRGLNLYSRIEHNRANGPY